MANQASDTVSILLGNGAGDFSAASGSPVLVGNCFRPGGACGPTGLATGPSRRRQASTLATSNAISATWSVLLGNGAGGFTAAAGSLYAVGDQPFSLVLTRHDRITDAPDIAAANYLERRVAALATKAP